MPYPEILEQVLAITSGVEGAGVGHRYQRWAETYEQFLDLFKDAAGRINGFCITRDRAGEKTVTTSHNERIHRIRMRFYRGLNDADASELDFQQYIDDTCTAFRSKRTLNGAAADTTPVQVEVIDNRMFGGVLCHFAELVLAAEEAMPSWS